MKAVMLSIRPEWCKKIADGKKTIEVRKSKPKLKTPFRSYIYQTLPKCGDWNERDGRVIGEFVCNYIYEDAHGEYADVFIDHALLDLESQKEYGGGKMLYGWHISELKIYDKPKALSEFLVEDNRTFDCPQLVTMKRAPQSWCYVEGVLDNG